MKLLRDDYQDIFVWVDDNDETIELSPHFDYEEDADEWYIKAQNDIQQNKRT
jgi:hypothetical protein